jgi:hypothetical protein
MRYRAALLLYAGSVGLAGALLALLWTYIAYVADLITGMDAALRRVLLIRFLSVPAGFVGSIPVILLGWGHVAVALWILVPPAVRLLLRWRHRRPSGDRDGAVPATDVGRSSHTSPRSFTDRNGLER